MNNSTDRRQFLKSLLGLGSTLETAVLAKDLTEHEFIFAQVRTGALTLEDTLRLEASRPGSLMKLVAAAALQEEALINEGRHFECFGHVRLHGQDFHCQTAHGVLNLPQAIGRSCNCFFAQASELLSPSIFIEYARFFMLDKDLSGFPKGKFPVELKHYSQPYVLGLAEDLLLSPGHILRMMLMIASCGNQTSFQPSNAHPQTENKPTAAGEKSEVKISGEQPDSGPAIAGKKLSKQTWDVLHEGMHLATTIGTAKNLDPEGKLKLAVKTGTVPHGNNFYSWVAGFFPLSNPSYVVCLRTKSGTSQDQAVPLLRKELVAHHWL
jgi:cell division protein FtsI/penicillin-binding protein 2